MGISNRIKSVVVAALCTASVASPAVAGTRTTDMDVSATVTGNCTISASELAFPDVDTLSGTAVTGTGGLSVRCTNGTGWTAAADIGDGSGASYTNRRMTAGGNTLNYNLFTSGTYGTVWGDGTGGSATIGGTGTGSVQNITIHGRIPAGQTAVPAGDYTDLIGITVTY